MGDDEHGAALCAQLAQQVSTICSAAPSRWAVGSSSTTSGAGESRARASARRCRSPRESPCPRRPRSASRPRCAMTASRPTAAAAAPSSSSPASGRAPARTSRRVPGGSTGRWGSSAIWSQRLRRSSSRTSVAVPSAAITSARPCSGSSRPSSTCTAVVFPAPEGPVSAVMRPGRTSISAACGASPSREATLTPRRARVAPARSGAGRVPSAEACSSSTSKAAPTAARPSVEEWYWEPTLRSGWYTSGARTSTASAGARSISP